MESLLDEEWKKMRNAEQKEEKRAQRKHKKIRREYIARGEENERLQRWMDENRAKRENERLQRWKDEYRAERVTALRTTANPEEKEIFNTNWIPSKGC